MAEEWKIRRDRARCEKPACPLPTAERYYAVLELPSCTRRDFCEACFLDYERRSEERPVFWRAPRRQDGQKGPVLDLASLRILFDRLGESDGERARGLRYFCALLLLRKRLLKVVAPRTAEEQRADLVVVDPKIKEMEPVALFAPSVDLHDLGAIKDELLAAIGEEENTDRE
ncbi:MAG: hypothetical protein Fur0037_15450 [Planctomycetota bacterium]